MAHGNAANQAPSSGQCPKCGKKLESGKKASLTAYLFQGARCTCETNIEEKRSGPEGLFRDLGASVIDRIKRQHGSQAETIQAKKFQDKKEEHFCPKCGLMIAETARPGSITGYIFQDIRCKCASEPAFNGGVMSKSLFKVNETNREITLFGDAEKDASTVINLAPGAIIGGAYEIGRLIGRGGMGEIYFATHLGLERQCALKVIPPEQVTEFGWLRFQAEARAVSKLNHTNIVQISDLGIHDGALPFYAMEYVPGENLAELLHRSGPMQLSKALEIFKQVCDGVEHAHRNGIIHRDLKPNNIMVAVTADKPVVKILDFGLAKLTQADRSRQSLTAVGDIFGSPYYMSPEQCAGERLDNRSDLYSIGCALFECLTGRPPFIGNLSGAIMLQHQQNDAPQLASALQKGAKEILPDGIEVVVAKLLRKNPVERYQTCGELKSDLLRVERGESIQPYYVPRSQKQFSKVRTNQADIVSKSSATYRRPFIVGTLAVILMCATAAAVHRVNFHPESKNGEQQTAVSSTSFRRAELPLFEEKPSSSSGPSKTIAGILEKTKDIPAYDGRPYFKSVLNGNNPSRLYVFPTGIDSSHDSISEELGYFVTDWDEPDANVLYRLAGRVQCERFGPMSFQPSLFSLAKPSYLTGFRDGDFQGLSIILPSDFGTETISKIGDCFGKFKSIIHVDVNDLERKPFGSKENALIKLINVFQGATSLGLNIPLTEAGISKIRRMKSLVTVKIQNQENISGYLRALNGSSSLESLYLDNCCVSSQDIEDITTFTNLKNLRLSSPAGFHLSHHEAKNICRLRNLVTLQLPPFENIIDIETFAALKNLQTFGLLEQKSGVEDNMRTGLPPMVAQELQELEVLNQKLPNCRTMVRTFGTQFRW